jgi:hypothetical protein
MSSDSWNVENLRVLDDERSNEGGASGFVFFGMQVELAFGAPGFYSDWTLD